MAPLAAPSRQATGEAAQVFRRFIEAVESGKLLACTPLDIAVVRRLQGALVAPESERGLANARTSPALPHLIAFGDDDGEVPSKALLRLGASPLILGLTWT